MITSIRLEPFIRFIIKLYGWKAKKKEEEEKKHEKKPKNHYNKMMLKQHSSRKIKKKLEAETVEKFWSYFWLLHVKPMKFRRKSINIWTMNPVSLNYIWNDNSIKISVWRVLEPKMNGWSKGTSSSNNNKNRTWMWKSTFPHLKWCNIVALMHLNGIFGHYIHRMERLFNLAFVVDIANKFFRFHNRLSHRKSIFT